MTRSIIIWAIVIVVIIGGIFLYWKFGPSMSSTPETTDTNEDQAATAAASQVQGQDVTIGTGAEATPGSLVSVLYVGRLQDGTVFDSSEKNGNQPLVFQLGAEGIIPGFQIGVNSMKEGGERRIAIPPEFGYGNQDVKDPAGIVIIPANSTLVFDIKLVKVESAPAAPAEGVQETQE
ncbi:MAG: FKBP-type peptidyl-prolyl cis-trans isomerase [Patescibacteria group bacterium]